MVSVLLQTPPETLIHILSYLDWRQLVSAQRISRSFQELIRNSVELQYLIELGADGLVDNADQGDYGLVTTQDRLALLLDRRRRWRMLDWTHKASVGFPPRFRLIGGVCAGEDQTASSPLFVATWLPTRYDLCTGGTEQPQRTVKGDLPGEMEQFDIDPTQDVLALLVHDTSLKAIVDIRTLSSHETHPLARLSPLVLPTSPFDIFTPSVLKIVGDIISVLYWWLSQSGLLETCLRIWNWHTGVVLVSQSDFSYKPRQFAFLSPRAYMIACEGSPGSLDLYEIHDSTASSDTVKPPTCVLRLRLPEVLPHKPGLMFVQSPPFVANPEALHSPFVQRQGQGIHQVKLTYEATAEFTLYVKNETLLDMMAQVREGKGVANHLERAPVSTPRARFATSGAPDAPPTEMYENMLGWKQWGPRYTRFLPWNEIINDVWSINGHRIVFAFSRRRNPKLHIFDFNVHPNRKDDPCSLDPDDGDGENRQWAYEVHTEETVVPRKDIFVEPVVSSLPYSVVSRRMDGSAYDKFLIDEQRLIGMKSNLSDAPGDIGVFTM